MRKKKVPEPVCPPKIKYTCSWCGKEKAEYKFFRCSLDKGLNICTDCIKAKYDEVASQYGKMLAIIVCCHYLDVGFNYDIFKSLKPNDGIGYYLRQFNLLPNRNQNPDNFEQGLLKSGIIQPASNYTSNVSIKQELTNVIEELERVRNGI